MRRTEGCGLSSNRMLQPDSDVHIAQAGQTQQRLAVDGTNTAPQTKWFHQPKSTCAATQTTREPPGAPLHLQESRREW